MLALIIVAGDSFLNSWWLGEYIKYAKGLLKDLCKNKGWLEKNEPMHKQSFYMQSAAVFCHLQHKSLPCTFQILKESQAFDK